MGGWISSVFSNKIKDYPNAVYVNSITYGRMAIISIESDTTYTALKTAFKAALNAKMVNGEVSMDASSEQTLQKAEIHIWIRGGKGADAVATATGFNEFTKFIVNGGTFTKDVPGQPIYCTVNRVDDNSAFSLNFDTDKK